MISPREPIGGLPKRRQGRLDAMFQPFQPQQAWLQGTLLIVEFNRESTECDLATAARIRIRQRPWPIAVRGWGTFDVLYAHQDDRSTPARLVLAGPDGYLLTGEQFRRLAELISARRDSSDRPVREIIRALKRMADQQDIRSNPLDWSFRTDPQGLRKKQEPQ